MEQYYLINIILISRLIVFWKDEKITSKQFFLKTIILIAGILIFKSTIYLFCLVMLLIVNNFIFYVIENKKNVNLSISRIFELLISVIITSFFFSEKLPIYFNSYLLYHGFYSFKNYFTLFGILGKINWPDFLLGLMGLLFVMNEVNFLIRAIFQITNLIKINDINKKDNEFNERELQAGRVIGMLERIIIYLFAFSDQYGIIGFVIAAKAFARFKALDEREFAEYVLIGTLLSTILAFSAVFLVRFLK